MSTIRLTPTSFVVLGLLEREGPSTPYDLKGHVAATLGHFWSFQHTLLYQEPPRLAGMGLVNETREQFGRRRRVFAITDAGRAALRDWLLHPSTEMPELRDPGLLQLFFADLVPTAATREIALAQLKIHRAKLAAYEDAEREDRHGGPDVRGRRTVEHWRGATLPMGLLHERAAVQFWDTVANSGDADGAA